MDGQPPTIRRAAPADAGELTRLRGLMFAAMGADAEALAEPAWQQACTAVFARRADGDPSFAAMVVDDAAGGLAACGVGWVEQHLPGPSSPDGCRGHVASMSTQPAARGRGLGTAVFAALLAWFREQGVARVELSATPAGERVYRAAGFAEPTRGTFLTTLL